MLDKKQKYLQIALNSTLNEAQRIISTIPLDQRIILEVGTPLIKSYGIPAIKKIKFWWAKRAYFLLTAQKEISWREIVNKEWSSILISRWLTKSQMRTSEEKKIEIAITPYIVADLKCMDRGEREVEIAKEGGADGAVVLGQAPIETIDVFIETCEKLGLDSMVDMMNVEYPLSVLSQLKKLPNVVILHRGVDEEAFDPESEIPFHEIQRIKERYDILVAVAGGDTIQEVQRAIFNDADIVVVWKSFYKSTAETAKLVEEFLKEIQ